MIITYRKHGKHTTNTAPPTHHTRLTIQNHPRTISQTIPTIHSLPRNLSISYDTIVNTFHELKLDFLCLTET